MTDPKSNNIDLSADRRWPAIIAALAVGGLFLALPESLVIGPRWLQLAIISILVVPTMLTHRMGQHHLNQVLGHCIAAILTIFMVWSLVLLIIALPSGKEPPIVMLRSAAALWVTNVLVFALWYWRLDGGGPHHRLLKGRNYGAFLFPQMAIQDKQFLKWTPIFVDYLFLAFNTSTAFSPTDSPVLSRWAKLLTMMQAAISLSVIAILAARAVNIL